MTKLQLIRTNANLSFPVGIIGGGRKEMNSVKYIEKKKRFIKKKHDFIIKRTLKSRK